MTTFINKENLMSDPTEKIRRKMVKGINAEPGSREDLEFQHGQVWDTKELSEDFKVIGFLAPMVVVERKSDNKMGSMEFQHSPRFYYGWKEDK